MTDELRKIYIVRHGETDWNKNRLFQGHADVALNETGRGQAEALARALAQELPFDRIVTSDLCRAKETADILNRGYDTPIFSDPGLREMNFGYWEGLGMKEIRSRWPKEAAEWLGGLDVVTIPGGEGAGQLFARAWQSFCDWAFKEDYQKMAIVIHGGTSGALICGILGKSIAEMAKYIPVNTGFYLVYLDAAGNFIPAKEGD